MRWQSLLSASAGPRASTAKVRRRILAAQSSAAVLRAWHDDGGAGDPSLTVTAIYCVGKTLDTGCRSAVLEDKRWQGLLRAALGSISKLTPADLSQLSWALARADATQDPLFRSIGSLAGLRLSEFRVRDLVTLAWSFARASGSNAALVAAVAEAMEGSVSSLSMMDAANLAWAFGKAEVREERLLLELAQHVAGRVPEFNPQDAANTAWGFAKSEVRHEPLFQALGTMTVEAIAGFGAQELASMVWAFAWVSFRHEAALRALAERATARAAELNAPGLARTAWAFAKLEKRPRRLFAAIGDQAVLRVEEFAPPTLAKIAWAFAKVELDDSDALRTLAARSACMMEEFSGRDLGMMAWAVARAGVQDDRLMEALAQASLRKIDTFTVQGLTKAISAFAALMVCNQELMHAVAREAVRRIDEIPAQGLADLAWANAALQANDEALAAAIASAPGWTERPQYKHRHHAGSVADCFKHTVLVMLLERMASGDGSFAYVDTHAGEGVYCLSSPENLELRSAEDGVHRLASRVAGGWRCPGPVVAFLEALRGCEAALAPTAPTGPPGASLRYYAGSAALGRRFLRSGDTAVLFEASAEACDALRRSLRLLGDQASVEVLQEDAYSGLRRLLPRLAGLRGLVFVDPPYDLSFSDQLNAALLLHVSRHWPSSSVALWYPIRDEARTARVYQKLRSLRLGPLLAAHLAVGAVRTGVLLVRPPERMDAQLQEVLPALGRLLAPDSQVCVGCSVFWL